MSAGCNLTYYFNRSLHDYSPFLQTGCLTHCIVIDAIPVNPGFLMLCTYLYFSNKPVTETADGWEVHYPGSVMQFLCLVNSLFPQDPLWTSPDFLTSLASAVFPFETPEVRLLGTVPYIFCANKNIPKRHFIAPLARNLQK